MTDTLSRPVGPVALTTSATTVLSALAASTYIAMRDIHVCNESSSDTYFTLSIGTDADGYRLYRKALIPANSTWSRQGNIVLVTGDILQAYASAGNALTLTISGVTQT